jgi:hypothetical protein
MNNLNKVPEADRLCPDSASSRRVLSAQTMLRKTKIAIIGLNQTYFSIN